MRDLRTLLDEAAGNPPDLPDLAAIRERGQTLKNRSRIRWAVGAAAASALVATGVGVALQGAGRDTMPAPQPSKSQTPVTNACAIQPSPPSDTIAYTVTRANATRAVHLMLPDGSGDRCLVDTPGPDTWPVWSPDGQWLAFIGGDGTQVDLFVVRADGSDLSKITDGPEQEEQPVWSPDGVRLGYTAHDGQDGPPSIHIVRRDGSDDATLSTGSSWVGLQDWSPDGGTLLYVRDDSSGGHIALWAMAPDGSRQRLLRAADGDLGTGARYSPDGTQIAFQADLDGGCIYRSDPTAQRLTRITTGCQQGKVLSWAPDGTQIVTSSGDRGPGDAEVMDMGDGVPRTITTGGNVAYADWQPSAAR